MHSRSPLPLLAAALALAACLAPLHTLQAQRAGTGEDIVFPTVDALEYTKTTIAIPLFKSVGDPGGLGPGFLSDIVANDLQIFSAIQPVSNPQFVARTHKRDVAQGRVDYAEWRRLSANFVLKSELKESQGTLVVECRLFDVDFRKECFGRRYRGYTPEKARTLAHRISDDVRKVVFGLEPIANSQILFVSARGPKGQKEIWLMDADGARQRQITDDKTIAATPCWGKNMTEMYYTTWKDGNPDLGGLQFSTGKWWYVSRWPNLNYTASWEPASQRITLTLGLDGNSEIYTMARSGQKKTLQRLTFTAGIDSSPCWNPAGNQIVFTSDRSRTPQIYVMDDNGANVRRLTLEGRYNDEAVWSPKGDKIAFTSRSRGVFDIHVMNIDGSARVRLTRNQGNNEEPTWSPDGEYIIFSSNRTGSSQLYLMGRDGTNQTQLTHRGANTSPAWSPGEPRL